MLHGLVCTLAGSSEKSRMTEHPQDRDCAFDEEPDETTFVKAGRRTNACIEELSTVASRLC